MKVSVVIPAHNEEKYLENTLKAASHPDAEVIVVCNGCTDDSAKVAKRFTKNVFILDEANVSKARNFGAAKASSSRIVFLDADILLGRGTLDSIISSRHSVGTCLAKSNNRKLVPRAVMALKSLSHYFGCCTGLIFCDKAVFDRAGGFDERKCIGEDGGLLRAAIRHGSYGVVNSYVYNNMRRFEKLGYSGVVFFWMKHFLFGSRGKYEVVR